ncbi:MAG: hypothetical protein ABW046_20785 [Actinoplanes sp.]
MKSWPKNRMPKHMDLAVMDHDEMQRYVRDLETELAVLKAVLAGDRSVAEVAEAIGIGEAAAKRLLDRLFNQDLLGMKVVGGTWHFIPVHHGNLGWASKRWGGTR